MIEAAAMAISVPASQVKCFLPNLNSARTERTSFPATVKRLGVGSNRNTGSTQSVGTETRRQRLSKMASSAVPEWASSVMDWPLMAVMVQHLEGQRDYVVHKSVWHLSDQAIKNVYGLYLLFTVWGCCFFASMKDPFYDSEAYRKEGGDGTVHWIYNKQEDIEENNRAELWREELIEEIELKVGGLRELEEAAGKEEELVK